MRCSANHDHAAQDIEKPVNLANSAMFSVSSRLHSEDMVSSRFEESILVSLRRMSRAVDLHSRQLAAKHQLTGPQLVCLRQLHREVITNPGALARAVSLSQGTVTGILDRLEARGLVRRARSSQDKRRVMVELTDAGRELVGAAPSPLQDRFSDRLGALPEGEQAMIDWVLQRVVSMMEAEHMDAAPMLSTGPMLAEATAVNDFLSDAIHQTPTVDAFDAEDLRAEEGTSGSMDSFDDD